MGKFDYQKIVGIAQKQFERFGTVAVITGLDGVTTRSVLVVRDKDVKYTLPGAGLEGVQVGDAQIWAMPTTTTGTALNPLQGEMITLGGNTFTMMARPNPIQPADVLMMWQLFGREGAQYASP